MNTLRLTLTSLAVAAVLASIAAARSHRSATAATAAADLVLTNTVVVISPHADSIETKAAQMLVEEVERRSGIRWKVSSTTPLTPSAQVLLGSRDRLPPGAEGIVSTFAAGRDGNPTADGYLLRTSSREQGARVYAIGNDARGCLFAAGRLLRQVRITGEDLRIPASDIVTAPHRPLRGHQLGWRPKSNTYDRWGLKEYEQYVRDLIVWGTNAIELIPLDPDGDFEESTEFNARLAEVIASYGLEVWLWYPFDDRVSPAVRGARQKPGDNVCPSEPDERAFLLQRRAALFKRFKRLDAVFIPGGDPGGCSCEKCRPWPKTLLPLARETAELLRTAHPGAQVWLSNQGFHGAENDGFYAFLDSKPEWLTGIVYAPWAEESLESMRKRAPASIPIRAYPDITHTVRCQYPARDWDNAFALTLDREPPIFRPSESVVIARLEAAHTAGAITYSDGVNDDLNKAIWSAVMWDAGATAKDVLAEYSRIHFGAALESRAVHGLLGLERNTRGPLASNKGIEKTLSLWTALERAAPDLTRRNWRFQMALLRANYDAYVQRRLAQDNDTEAEVLQALRTGTPVDPAERVRNALSGLNPRVSEAPPILTRLSSLGQALHDSIGMQLSVSRWGASGDERGAILDHLERPLANLEWLSTELTKLSRLTAPGAVRDGIERILSWEDPEPGGFYDDLGNPAKQPHLVRPTRWELDPGYLRNPRTDFRFPVPGGRQSWNNYAEALYDAPILMRYRGLDRKRGYRLRAVYGGRFNPVLKLSADGLPVHGPVASAGPPAVREWPIPRRATEDGELTLRWDRVEGRGAQICEVWLVRDGNRLDGAGTGRLK